jgi:hypothetical protein
VVDSVKQYNLAGVAANVELGKQGPLIIGSGSQVSFTDKNGNASVINIAQGTDPTHAVTLDQLTLSDSSALKYVQASVLHTDSNVLIANFEANTYIHSVTIDTTSTWVGADANTNITVGDSSDNARLFAGFDPGTQTTDEVDHRYASSSTVVAYVTAGGATGGAAKITLWYSGTLS